MPANPEQNEAAEALEFLQEEAVLNGAALLKRYPHHRFFGYFCSYFPEELILAAGLEPLRLFPASENSTPAELPSYCCSLARGTLELGKRGVLNDLSGVGFTHTCDTMQCLSGIWAASECTQTVNLVPPVMLKTAGASAYYLAELESVLNQLAELAQTEISTTKVREAVNLCRQMRALAGELDSLRSKLPSQLAAQLLRAGQVMPRAEYVKKLSAALPLLHSIAGSAEQSKPRINLLISGAILENDQLFSLIEDLGGRVVADDTCSGFRHYAGRHFEGTNPFEDVAQRYIEMPPCPCKHQALNTRPGYLNQLAQERKAEAGIIVIRKFCEPHAWDAVDVSNHLREQGLRTLILELESAAVSGQERTRLQAFLESLR